MISNQLLKKTIEEFKDISGVNLAVLDIDGRVVVRTFNDETIDADAVKDFVASERDSVTIPGFHLIKVKEDGQDEYVLAVRSSDANSVLVCQMVKYQLETLLAAYRERFDKDNFIKSLLMDNLLLVDIYGRAKKLHIEIEAYRCVIALELKEHSQEEAVSIIRNVFNGSNEDFVLALNKKTVIVVKKVDRADGYDEVDQAVSRLHTALKADLGEDAYIAYGTIVTGLKEVSKSYKEAKMALDVGHIFFEERNTISYNKLGMGRLIYQLPMPLCKLFIREIFGDSMPSEMDEETLNTINKFFENSLNVSETSRQLYIHRNTLVYRLDKIQKVTGLDLRVFSDAITFKIALMVSHYMQHVENLEFK